MARLQILELPEGASDERRPYLLIIDQADDATRASLASAESSLRDGLAEHIGARGILAFDQTIDIPANEITISPDGYPLTVRVEGDFDQFRQQVQDEAGAASRVLTGARYVAEQYAGQPKRSYDSGGGPSPQQLLDFEKAQRRDFVARLMDALGIEDRNPGIDLVEVARDIRSERDGWRDEATTSKTRLDETRAMQRDFREGLCAAFGMNPRRDGDGIVNAARERQQLAENFQGRALAAQERIRGISAEFRDALGLDNDAAIDVVAAARDMRRELDQSREAIRSVLHAHRGESHQGRLICVECSALDDQGTTDNAPVIHPCDTVKRIQAAFGEARAPEPEAATP